MHSVFILCWFGYKPFTYNCSSTTFNIILILPSLPLYNKTSNPHHSEQPHGKRRKRPPPSPPSPPPHLIIPQFDRFVFSHTWPSTFCKIHDNCIDKVSLKFLIHGLWPSNSNGPNARDCDPKHLIYNIYYYYLTMTFTKVIFYLLFCFISLLQ